MPSAHAWLGTRRLREVLRKRGFFGVSGCGLVIDINLDAPVDLERKGKERALGRETACWLCPWLPA